MTIPLAALIVSPLLAFIALYAIAARIAGEE
jgi:hypothetical protein